MKIFSIKNIQELYQKKIAKKIDKKILVYLVFVGFATVFWFLNKLTNEFNATVNYPVKYRNLPKNKVLVSELPKKLKLHVNAYGYSLLKYKISPVPFPVIINLKDYQQHLTREDVLQFTIHTRQIKSDINEQLGKDIDLLDVLPDTISFRFANIVSELVAVAPDAELEFDPQCMLEGKISFLPDSIVVKGPQTTLDTLKYVYTKKQKFKHLNKPMERNVALVEIENLKFAKKRVIMKLPVSKFTEAYLEVKINTINVPDSLKLITFPQKTKVNYMVSLSNYDKISADDFIFEVDYFDIEKLLGQKLSIKTKYQTTKVSSASISPNIVEYIIENKND